MTRTSCRPSPARLARTRPLSCRPLPAAVVAELERRYRREIDAAYAQHRAA